MEQTIEELLGVGTRISPRINKVFTLIKFAISELHSNEIIVTEGGTLNFLLAKEEFTLSMFALKKFDCKTKHD